MTRSDVFITIDRSRHAQRAWAAVTYRDRVATLRKLRQAIAEKMDEIVDTISGEIGKVPMDVLTGDLMVTLEQLKFNELNVARILRPRPISKPRFLFTGTRFVEFNEPFGVVLVFAPWNYPLQLAVIPMATALAAGNSVLLKCSEHAPRTADLIRKLCDYARIPKDLVQICCDPPEQAAVLIDAHPDLIFFTGSTVGGTAVATKAAERLIPMILELGGKDPAIVFNSCNLERSATGICYASFSNSGQVCVGSKRLYVQSTIYDRFLELFLDRVRQLKLGTLQESDLSPMRVEGMRARLCSQVQDAIKRGAVLRTDWSPEEQNQMPVVLTNVPPDASLLVQESFGPVVCIVPFESEEEVVQLANNCNFALSATIWTTDSRQARRVVSQLTCGSCCVNDAIRHVGNPYASFGGNKSSGYGRYRGVEGLRAFSRTKTVMFASARSKTEIHWFPFSSRTYNILRKVLMLRHNSRWWRRPRLLRAMLGLISMFTIGAPDPSASVCPQRFQECASTLNRSAQMVPMSFTGCHRP